MTASGTIYKGQAVCLCAGMDDTVYVPGAEGSGMRVFGIADYTATHGEKIAIWGPYNICRCRLSGVAGAAVTAGTGVGMSWDGMLGVYSATAPRYSGAIVLDGGVANGGEGIVLLTGPYGYQK